MTPPGRALPTAIASTILLLASSGAHALRNDPYVRRALAATAVPVPPTIDGALSDPAWEKAPKADTFLDLQNGSIVDDQTFAYLCYDKNNIYIGFRCKDSAPESITARETVRDSKYANSGGGGGGGGGSEDSIEVSFDPFQSHRSDDITRFSVNAIGTQSARLGGGRGGKVEWKGDWQGAVKRAEDGWTAEMSIPWAILNYPSGDKSITMGLNFTRFQLRTQIESIWSNIGPNRFNELQGIWTDVAVPRDSFKPKLSLLPYILPGLQRAQPGLRAGIDARYTLTPELTVVASANPDFGTIEGAVEGIQFSRSERFVPEKRPFFLEGRDYFQSGQFFGIGQFFYSPRILAFDAGAKIYGKLSPVDTIGLLSTWDVGDRTDTIARYRHDLSETSSFSAFLSNKSEEADNSSLAVLSHQSRWGKLSLSTDLGGSSGTDSGGSAKSASLRYQDKLFEMGLTYTDVAPSFRAADGLIFYTDYRGLSSFTEWGGQWRHGFWRSFSAFVYPYYYVHSDGRPFRRGGFVNLNLETRSDWLLSGWIENQKFDDETDATYNLRIRRGVTNRFRQWGIRAATGKQADRPYSFIGPEFSVRTLRKLDCSFAGAIQNLEGRQQQHIATLTYEFSPTKSIGGRVVVQDANTNWYLSYRNSGSKGMETFFIIGDPNAERFQERAAVKFVFAL